ncbi:5-(carboxyamino)imidazole ribonucleotide synthase [Paracoccus sp. 1_MG-2023]|uniref:5-(carboxyamino)imidazole ribonucleotide synthase n=1 Tax=unclassified Paracoccus (in: a-proteobacteria) TaxID=2688777 RepID=UPI001C086916|nr:MULTISPECIES: 5-(carboxyamino)imidazole ribonucleotide synthase [unclassified Paracoccus (in: a-proteobacteria)]MBU2958762.1 5-(carboxyamino)imidazole ribonucleotide synthase [Paracoccus sp. C2R09]MDO6667755.1 5-(carboxyamino)imidazole ribonucleotide synthase [Paracoccus sp. 1_MG-2023]
MTEIRTIGILGGGQLGRMLSVAASRLGLRCHIYEPGDSIAGDVAWRVTRAPYEDEAALRAFAESVDVITYEFENVPTSALDLLESLRPIRPNRRALAVSQDRLTEKNFLQQIGLRTAPFADVPDEAALDGAIERIGRPSILKTRRMGYDGKGQVRIGDGPAEWTGAASVLEGFVDFTAEISVIIARGADGQVAAFDPGLNVHEGGILRTTTVPCGQPARVTTDAVLMAAQIANALDYVGVLGVELFVTADGLIVNEIAPRVHNSGHWTQAGCAVDQFEQHIRAVAGLPLGDGKRYADVVMENLIGDDMARVPSLLAEPRVQLHLYGKGDARPGRKMGHANRITQ